MVDDEALRRWFCAEVLPLEANLSSYIYKNWRNSQDLKDLRQEIYELALNGARNELPTNTRAFLFVVARNHIINRAKRQKLVSFDLVADFSELKTSVDWFVAERHLNAREELRRAMAALAMLPPRCREVVRLRKIDGLSTRETAERMGVGLDTVERQLTMGVRAMADYMLGGTGRVQRSEKARKRRQRAT